MIPTLVELQEASKTIEVKEAPYTYLAPDDRKLKARVWWLRMSRDVEDYVRDCLSLSSELLAPPQLVGAEVPVSTGTSESLCRRSSDAVGSRRPLATHKPTV
eukprot:GHVS01083444.1.p3 GENE.GHVS01083444.1~~GHVS01083444.1.p3  ORF type:complete len:102 (-),score=5.81 GHVS01083444.1:357-662(-)